MRVLANRRISLWEGLWCLLYYAGVLVALGIAFQFEVGTAHQTPTGGPLADRKGAESVQG